MRRDEVVDGALAAALVPLALTVALPFRFEAIARTPVTSLGWDAALHAAEGLDLFDDLRLLHPLDALALLVGRHWWGPLWALVSAPFQAAFGPSLSAASLPSLAAFVLAPSAAYLLARRLAPGGLVAQAATFLLVAALLLRSPMLLETSAWPMLESLGGVLALVAWLLFARRPERPARRAAFLAGAALFFLKYHFAFFVLGTFAGVVLLEESPDARRRLGAAARAFLLRGAVAGIFALAAALASARAILEMRGNVARAHLAPSIPNVAWGAFVLFAVLLFFRRHVFTGAWRGASGTLRDFVLFGLLPPAVWCLDPANLRDWYRQLFPPTQVPEWNPLAKLATFWSFLKGDYMLGAGPASLVLFGLVLALLLPGDRTRRAFAAFAVWPTLLMSLDAYPLEPRFLACLIPGAFTGAVAGLAALAARLGERARGPALAAAAILLSLGLDPVRWRAECAGRATYAYAYSPAEVAAVNAAVAAAPATGPIRLRVPSDPPVWPTVRLVLRLGRRDLAPADVDVSQAP